MPHPLQQLTPSKQSLYFRWLTLLALLTILVLNLMGSPLNTPAAPYGIISYEFAYTPARAQAMLDSWDDAARVRAGFAQGLDFLFPLLYSNAIALGCLVTSASLTRRGLPLGGLGAPLAWGSWLAAFLDYIENIALVIQLFGKGASPWAETAAICAGVKFALVLVGFGYALYGLASRLLDLRNRRLESA